MADNLASNKGKTLKNSNDDYKTSFENGTLGEVSVLSQKKKSNHEIIKEEFLEKMLWYKRVLNWQSIMKIPINIVKRR